MIFWFHFPLTQLGDPWTSFLTVEIYSIGCTSRLQNIFDEWNTFLLLDRWQNHSVHIIILLASCGTLAINSAYYAWTQKLLVLLYAANIFICGQELFLSPLWHDTSLALKVCQFLLHSEPLRVGARHYDFCLKTVCSNISLSKVMRFTIIVTSISWGPAEL